MTRRRRRVAVLISGRGSNLVSLIEHCARPDAPATIGVVLADRPAAGIEHARAARIPAEVVDRSAFEDREGFEQRLEERLLFYDIEITCLAGFMRILSPGLAERWRDRMLNIHPSLLPAFRGLEPHRQALDAGVRLHGCTVHLVRTEVDAGPIVIQGAVPVHEDDTADTLAARVLEVEHRCYPRALDLLAAGRLRVVGERVLIDGAETSAATLINPSG